MAHLIVLVALFLLAGTAPAHAGAELIIAGLASAGVTVASGSVAAFAIRIGVSLAYTALAQALGAGAANANAAPQGIVLRSTTAGEQTPQSFILGTYVTAGNLTAPEMSHGVNGDTRYLTRVVDLSDVQVTGLEALIIDGVKAELATGTPSTLNMSNGDGTTPAIHPDYGPTVNKGDFIGFAWCRFKDGSQTSADAMLLDKYGSYPQRPWETTMVGRGVAYAVMTFLWRDSPQVWQGAPDVKFIVNGIRLYDPRKDSTVGGSGAHRYGTTSTHEFSDNPVVMIYNLLRGIQIRGGHIYGGGFTAAQLPYAVWAAAMNACDVLVGSRKSYTAGFEVFMGGTDAGGQSPADVVEELLRTCAGQIADVGGTIYIRVGAPGLPVKFITDDDILIDQPQDLDPFPGAEESWNVVHATWVNPSRLWTVKEATPKRDEDAIAADGQELVANLALPAVTNGNQVQQLMSSLLKDAARQRRLNITLLAEGVLLRPLDVIDWTSDRNGYVGKAFEIGQVGIDPSTLATTLSLREVDPADYDWEVGDEIAIDAPSIEPVANAAQSVPGFVATATTIKDGAGADRKPAVRLAWSTPLPGVTGVRFQIRVNGTNTVAVEGSTANADTGYHVVSEGIVANVAYQARARLVGPKTAAWTSWVSVTAPNVGITESDFQGSIEEVFLNAGLAPVEIVNALPSTGNFEGRTVYLTTDNQLYRHTGSPAGVGGWTTAVPAVNVTGQLTDAQIADIAAAKMTGQITTTQISDSAISTPKISAGAVSTAKIAAGAITADEIAANAVVAGKVDAGAITSNKIAANAVTSAKIAANAITAGLIAAGAINTTDLIVDGAVSRRVYARGSSITSSTTLQTVVTKGFGSGSFAAWQGAAGDRTNPILLNLDMQFTIYTGGTGWEEMNISAQINVGGTWQSAFLAQDIKIPLDAGFGFFQYTKAFVIDSGSWSTATAMRVQAKKNAAFGTRVDINADYLLTQISV